MSKMPPGFEWLNDLTGPLMVVQAVKLYGVIELPGPGDNPIIMQWARETGLDHRGYVHDEIPWCGLFMAVVAMRAGKFLPPEPLRALSWAEFGMPSPEPSLGDVLVYKRFNGQGQLVGGHVTLYVSEDDTHYYGLGGNQSDSVDIASKLKSSLHACRRPVYRNQPAEVKPIRIGPAVAAVPTDGKEV